MTGCGGAGPSSDGVQELRDMEAAFERAAASGDVDAFMVFWAEDAAYLPMHAPVITGKENIRNAWSPLLEMPGARLTWQPDHAELAASGDLGYTYGNYQMTVPTPDGGSVTREGKYTSIWRRDAQGDWKVVLDTGNPNTPAPGPQ